MVNLIIFAVLRFIYRLVTFKIFNTWGREYAKPKFELTFNCSYARFSLNLTIINIVLYLRLIVVIEDWIKYGHKSKYSPVPTFFVNFFTNLAFWLLNIFRKYIFKYKGLKAALSSFRCILHFSTIKNTHTRIWFFFHVVKEY